MQTEPLDNQKNMKHKIPTSLSRNYFDHSIADWNAQEVLRCGKFIIQKLREGKDINTIFNMATPSYGFHRTHEAFKRLRKSVSK